MDDLEPDLGSAVDRALKVLVDCVPSAFLRLAGVCAPADEIHLANPVVNVPELRADHVFRVGALGAPGTWHLHLEYQLQPDARVLSGWCLKNAALNYQLKSPVILVAVYVRRGSRATFPNRHRIEGGPLANTYLFEVLRVWEHLDRIRSGELAELAPLLALSEDEATEETLVAERELIRNLEAPPEVRQELFGVAVMLGVRQFSRALLQSVFREEIAMIKESSIFDDWFQEREALGEARGEVRGARKVLLRQLSKRFGELPAPVTARIEELDADHCFDLAERMVDAATLDDLKLG